MTTVNNPNSDMQSRAHLRRGPLAPAFDDPSMERYRTAYRAVIPVTMVLLGVVSGLSAAGRGYWVFWLVALFLFTLLGLPQHIAAWRLAAREDADAARADTAADGL